jgi:lysophospholipase L1-like esterase
MRSTQTEVSREEFRRAFRMLRLIFVGIMLFAGVFSFASEFKPGTRWFVLGDSITHGGYYHRWIELFYTTRYPDRDVTVWNAGVGGDSADGALSRLKKDVLAHDPTVVSIMFGMNDIRRALYLRPTVSPADEQAREERITDYENNLRTLIQQLTAKGIETILITPSPADDTMVSGSPVTAAVNEGLARCSETVQRLGRESGVEVIDFFNPMLKYNLLRQKEDPSYTLIGRDRVHPGKEGHFLMMHLFLSAQMPESMVSSVTLDAAEMAVIETNNGSVSGMTGDAGRIEFTFKANALPFPIPAGLVSERSLEFGKQFNREILRVLGLNPGRYELRIDGESAGIFSGDELKEGVDLAAIDTPQMRQAVRVADLLERKQVIDARLSDLSFCELRAWGSRPEPVDISIMAELLKPLVQAELSLKSPRRSVMDRYNSYAELKFQEEALRGEMEELVRAARKAARPEARRYELLLNTAGEAGAPDEIWLCAGQSNMAFPVDKATEADEIAAAAEAARILYYTKTGWEKVDRKNAGLLSAVAVSFATARSQQTGKSIGICVAARGGTGIEAWIPPAQFPDTEEGRRLHALADNPDVLKSAEEDRVKFLPWGKHRLFRWGLGRAAPGSLFEQLILPLTGLHVNGVLWYQGETDAQTIKKSAEYKIWLQTLFKVCRDVFDNERLPFVLVQLPEFDPDNEAERAAWASIQMQQADAAKTDERTVLVDIRDLGEVGDIHPPRKKEVGVRAAEATRMVLQ